jgi:hypothetical protein
MAKRDTTDNTDSAEKKTFKRGKALVLPSYSLKKVKEGDSLFLRIENEMQTKPMFNNKTGEQDKDDDGKLKNITVVKVTDLNTGEQGEMVCPFMIHKTLESVGDYVGKEFEMVKGAKKGRTDEWAVYELEV